MAFGQYCIICISDSRSLRFWMRFQRVHIEETQNIHTLRKAAQLLVCYMIFDFFFFHVRYCGVALNGITQHCLQLINQIQPSCPHIFHWYKESTYTTCLRLCIPKFCMWPGSCRCWKSFKTLVFSRFLKVLMIWIKCLKLQRY